MLQTDVVNSTDFCLLASSNSIFTVSPSVAPADFRLVVALVQNVLIAEFDRLRQRSAKIAITGSKSDCIAVLQLTVSEKTAIDVCPVC